jgi:hypothetical protein
MELSKRKVCSGRVYPSHFTLSRRRAGRVQNNAVFGRISSTFHFHVLSSSDPRHTSPQPTTSTTNSCKSTTDMCFPGQRSSFVLHHPQSNESTTVWVASKRIGQLLVVNRPPSSCPGALVEIRRPASSPTSRHAGPKSRQPVTAI